MTVKRNGINWFAYFFLKVLYLFMVMGNISFMVATGHENLHSVSPCFSVTFSKLQLSLGVHEPLNFFWSTRSSIIVPEFCSFRITNISHWCIASPPVIHRKVESNLLYAGLWWSCDTKGHDLVMGLGRLSWRLDLVSKIFSNLDDSVITWLTSKRWVTVQWKWIALRVGDNI